jgi:hypothetical protein
VLLHPGEGDPHRLGELADAGVAAAAEPLENCSAGWVGQGGEGSIDLLILNHMVQYSVAEAVERPGAGPSAGRRPSSSDSDRPGRPAASPSSSHLPPPLGVQDGEGRSVLAQPC